jgi:uncharacterized membrane protein YcaP (DUF421 family)
MNGSYIFEDWNGLVRVTVIGIVAYAALVLMLRVSGKRTLSKMNAFDLIVTVALGSTLATIILSKDVALAEGLLALVLLIGLQYAVTWSSVRWKLVSQLVKSSPTLLFYRGAFLSPQMRSARVVEDEVLAGVREQGFKSMHDVGAVVLETDGSFSVIPVSENSLSTLGGLARPPLDGSDAPSVMSAEQRSRM